MGTVFGLGSSGAFFTAGMRAATAIISDSIRTTAAAMPSAKIPPTVRWYMRGNIGYVGAGGPGGRVAPAAYMFETPGARHPFFARVGTWRYLHHKWYTQPYRPFMEVGFDVARGDASQALMEVWGYPFAESLGFDVSGVGITSGGMVRPTGINRSFMSRMI
jgi:hypothetical protein